MNSIWDQADEQLMQWTVHVHFSKFMHSIWDQADGPSPKSWLHQFHREQVFTGQWSQMNRWRESDSYPQLTLFHWLLCFPCHCGRQSVFPAYPGALSCKASSQRVSFWALFNLSAFAFLRLSDEGTWSPQSVRALRRGVEWWHEALVGQKAQLPHATLGALRSVCWAPSACHLLWGMVARRRDNSTLASTVGTSVQLLLCHSTYLVHPIVIKVFSQWIFQRMFGKSLTYA